MVPENKNQCVIIVGACGRGSEPSQKGTFELYLKHFEEVFETHGEGKKLWTEALGWVFWKSGTDAGNLSWSSRAWAQTGGVRVQVPVLSLRTLGVSMCPLGSFSLLIWIVNVILGGTPEDSSEGEVSCGTGCPVDPQVGRDHMSSEMFEQGQGKLLRPLYTGCV